MLIKNFISNAAILFSFLFIGGELFKNKDILPHSPLLRKILAGILAGSLGIILMLFSVETYSEVVLDLRQFAIIITAFYGGLIATAITGLMMSAFRIIFYGLSFKSLLGVFAIITQAIGCGIIARLPMNHIKKWLYMNILSIGAVNAALFITLRGSSLFRISIVYFTVISGIVGLGVYYISNYINFSTRLHRQYKIESQIADDLTDLITLHKPDGTYLHLSSSSEKLLGYHPEELRGTNPYTLLHPEDVKAGKLNFLNTDPDQTYTVQYRIQRKDGRYLWFESKLKTIVDKDGIPTQLICVSRDISARRKIDAELIQASQRNQEILESIQDAFFALDQNWYFTYVNKEAETLLDKSRDEILGKCVWNEFAGVIGSKFYKNYQEVMTEKIPKYFEEYYPPLNKWFNVSAYPAKRGISVYFRDITARKISERKLIESENKFRSLVKSMNDMVFTLDTNQRLTGIFGKGFQEQNIREDQYKGRTLQEFLGTENSQIHQEANLKVLAGKKIIYEWEYPAHDGIKYYQTALSPIENESGQIIGIVGVGRDITPERLVKQELIRANEKLKELSLLDQLTLIPNQKFFMEKIKEEWNRAIRHSHPLSLLILNIDHFGIYNETYSHAQGDECLRRVAKALGTTPRRASDFVAHLTGDTFAVILPGTDQEGATYVGENIRKNVEKLMLLNIHSKIKPYITISVGGVTILPSLELHPADLIEHAEKNLRKAKQNGRNRLEHQVLSVRELLQSQQQMPSKI